MKTHAERFRHLMQVWNLTQEQLGEMCGLKRGTIGTIVNGKTVPDVDALAMLLRAQSDLNADWLILGAGPMLRGEAASGEPAYRATLRELQMKLGVPAAPLEPPAPAEPRPDYSSAAGTVDAVVNGLLRQQLEEKDQRLADKETIIAMQRVEIERLRSVGKFDGSSDAADDLSEEPSDPTQPPFAGGVAPQPMLRRKAGFRQRYMDAAELP